MVTLEARDLQVMRDGHALIDGIGVTLHAGQITAVLGPNGAGKSSLIKTLSGEWRAENGVVFLHGQPLAALAGADRARRLAVLPQQCSLDFPYQVRDVVGWGRMPHSTGRVHDAAIVQSCLEMSDVLDLAAAPYTHLSGGERQRVQWARVMAQVFDVEGAVILMDEPTSALDLAHQHLLLSRLREHARLRGQAVLMSLHDVNLAARYADRLLLMKRGRLVAEGPTSSIMTPDTLRDVFGIEVRVLAHPHDDHPLVVI